MIGILGGKFGFYGWLEAVAKFYPNEKICVEVRNEGNPFLDKFKDKITFVKDSKSVIFFSDFLILAIPPAEVEKYILDIQISPYLKKLIIEKPICSDPIRSQVFIELVEANGIQVISSYLFLYTDWYQQLKDITIGNKIAINWNFKNTNSNWSWKTQHHNGGGALRFYGIHFIAVLASLGYDCCVNSKLSKNYDFFTAEISSSYDRPIIYLNIDNTGLNENSFELNIYPKDDIPKNLILWENPFSEKANDYSNDNRIYYLIKNLDEFQNNYQYVNHLIHKTNSLWNKIETQLEII